MRRLSEGVTNGLGHIPGFWRKFSATMTDPLNALQSFQQALLRGEIQPQRGVLDKNIYVYVDQPEGETRFTYVRLEGKTVTAFVSSLRASLLKGRRVSLLVMPFPNHIETKDAQRKLSARQYQRCNTGSGGSGGLLCGSNRWG